MLFNDILTIDYLTPRLCGNLSLQNADIGDRGCLQLQLDSCTEPQRLLSFHLSSISALYLVSHYSLFRLQFSGLEIFIFFIKSF